MSAGGGETRGADASSAAGAVAGGSSSKPGVRVAAWAHASEAPEAALWLAPGADLSAEPMLRAALMAASRRAPSLAMQLVQLGDEWCDSVYLEFSRR